MNTFKKVKTNCQTKYRKQLIWICFFHCGGTGSVLISLHISMYLKFKLKECMEKKYARVKRHVIIDSFKSIVSSMFGITFLDVI